MTVLMVGATGKFAGLVLPPLLSRGVAVRALVQNAHEDRVARSRGATETALGNLRDPTSLRSAAEGADGVFHINPAFAPDEADMGVSMVEAAAAAGVRKFVFSSVYHPSISAMVNHAAKRPVEEAAYGSGMDYTVLQPAMFMQNLEGMQNTLRDGGQISMPYSKLAKVCYVDYRDVADVVAMAMTDDALSYGTFELCSPGMVNRVEIAALMSKVTGRTIEAGETSPEEWAASARLPEGPLRDGLMRMNAHYDRFGFSGGNALVLRAILGREPRTLEQYFHELAQPSEALA